MRSIASLLGLLLLSSSALALNRPVLKGTNFKEYHLEEFIEGNTKALVLFFSATHCPLVRQYIPTIKRISEKYGPKGVRFLAIYSDHAVNSYSIGMHALRYDLPIRALWDQESKLAREVSAEITTQTIILDREKKILYSGAIDDQYSVSGSKPFPTERYLEEALDAILAGHSVRRSETRASGCMIELSRPTQTPEKKTYYEHVAPIIQEKCLPCHRPGQVGSTYASFTSYEEISPFANTIRRVVLDRRMPPFYGTFNEKYAHPKSQRQLTNEEVATIDAWVLTGAEAGDPKRGPAPKVFSQQEWLIGKPDLVVGLPKPYKVPATGILDYQFFKVKLNFPKDRWVQAAEMKPGAHEVVHHMELHIVPSNNEDYSGPNGMMKLYGITGDAGQLLQGYVPGDTDDNARRYPEGQAMRIPKNSDLVFEVHYQTVGREMFDQSRAAFIWAKAPPETEICSHAFRVKRTQIKIPPHADHVSLDREMWFKKDVLLHSIRPHMHRLGKYWKADFIFRNSDGEKVREFFAGLPNWDFNWQRSMDLAKPIEIKAGQEILMTGIWDNSKFNPNNPDPARPKIWGLQSTEEMLSTRIKFSIIKKPGTEATCREAIP
jgi:thiol-disulfide isomerase/thioredoxin